VALPKPIGRQREVVYLPAQGHQVILGTAGSGKTSMAVLRAALLSNANFPGSGKTLLVTVTVHSIVGAHGLSTAVERQMRRSVTNRDRRLRADGAGTFPSPL